MIAFWNVGRCFFFLSDILYLKVGSDLDLVIDITLHLSSDRVSFIWKMTSSWELRISRYSTASSVNNFILELWLLNNWWTERDQGLCHGEHQMWPQPNLILHHLHGHVGSGQEGRTWSIPGSYFEYSTSEACVVAPYEEHYQKILKNVTEEY